MDDSIYHHGLYVHDELTLILDIWIKFYVQHRHDIILEMNVCIYGAQTDIV